jgi:phenylpropionate dioxygenase-like ring-hydroxylating dioxygenase large terminal subunit
MLALHEAGTTDQAATTYRIPTSSYVDPVRWQLEIDRIFRRVPLPLALSCELREPGAYKALDAVGVPVLIVRGDDGVVRAFVNSCRHRGSLVVGDGCGTARRFTCPYHAWSYDRSGCLAGIYGEESFGPVDKSTMGLHELPCAERVGLVFVTLQRDAAAMDIDEWLGDMAAELAALDLEHWHAFSTRELATPAWKVAFDGYLECYHFASLHRETIFTQNMSNVMAVDAYGPHQRTLFAKHSLPSLREQPEDAWEPEEHLGPVHTLFPCLAVAGGWRDTALVSLLLPGPTAHESRTVQTFLTRDQVVTDEQRRRADAANDFLYAAVRDEDNPMGLGITRALQSNTTTELVFGRNEPTLHHFHRWVDHFVEGEPA